MEGKVEDEGMDGSASFWEAEGKLKKKPRSSCRTGLVSVVAWLLQGRTKCVGGSGALSMGREGWRCTCARGGGLLSPCVPCWRQEVVQQAALGRDPRPRAHGEVWPPPKNTHLS